MDDTVRVECSCGKAYSVPPERLHKKLRCKVCGGVFVATPAGTESEADDFPTDDEAEPSAVERAAREDAPRAPRPSAVDGPEPPPVDAMKLMGGMASGGLTPTLLVAVVAHVAIIVLTSFGFGKLCLQYGTLDPRSRIRAEKEAEDKEAKRARLEAERLKRKAQQEEQKKQLEQARAKRAEADDVTGGEGGASPVERRIMETSDERPTEPTTGIDSVLDLE